MLGEGGHYFFAKVGKKELCRFVTRLVLPAYLVFSSYEELGSVTHRETTRRRPDENCIANEKRGTVAWETPWLLRGVTNEEVCGGLRDFTSFRSRNPATSSLAPHNMAALSLSAKKL